MNKPKILQCARLAALCLITAASALRGITLTGNVEADFISPEAAIVTDGDVPMWTSRRCGHLQPPGGTSRTFDLFTIVTMIPLRRDQFFRHRRRCRRGWQSFGHSTVLTGHGGTDVANLGQTEAIQILFDWNEDGVFDTIAGVPTDAAATAFSIAPDVSPGLTLPADFRPVLAPRLHDLEPFVGALNATAPDFEFKIPNVSTLPGFDAVSGFKFRAYAGSNQDDGIGEDFVGNSGALHVDLPAPVPEPPAAPVVSLTELIVSRSHFNFWGTAAGEGGIVRVEYKSDQKRWTRFEKAKGTTSWRFNIRRDGYQSLRVVIRAINTAGDASPEMVVEIQP